MPENRTLIRFVFAFALLLITSVAPAATITVDSISDAAANDGQCTLREAITASNTNSAGTSNCTAGSGVDTISFSGLIGTGPFLITVTSALPPITEAVTINGYTQGSATANT